MSILAADSNFHVNCRVLLRAANLRHGTDGFTSPPKEGMLSEFFARKIRRLRPGSSPQSWVNFTFTFSYLLPSMQSYTVPSYTRDFYHATHMTHYMFHVLYSLVNSVVTSADAYVVHTCNISYVIDVSCKIKST
jgi:hypothetical protein